MEDLKGKKVCAPNGSTSMDKLRTLQGTRAGRRRRAHRLPRAVPGGQVDAITGDDTVLAGLAAQDPYAEVVQAPALHRGALRPGSQQGQRGLRPVRQRRRSRTCKSDGRWTSELQHLAGRGAGRGTDSAQARVRTGADDRRAPTSATAPAAPGRLGQPHRGRSTPLSLPRRARHLARPAQGRARRSSTRPPCRPRTQSAYTRRHAALDGAVEGGRRPLRPAPGDLGLRAGRTDGAASGSRRWCGVGSTPPVTCRPLRWRGRPDVAGALAVSLPEACRLSDALAASLRARLASTPRRPTPPPACASCALQSSASATSSSASRHRRMTRRAASSTSSTTGSPTLTARAQAWRRHRRPDRSARDRRRPGRARPHRRRRQPSRRSPRRRARPGPARGARGARAQRCATWPTRCVAEVTPAPRLRGARRHRPSAPCPRHRQRWTPT